MTGRTVRARSAAALLAGLLAVAGCGDSSADKAGGSHRKATVLTFANPSPGPGELQAFADEVAKRSRGRLRIEFKSNWRAGQRDFERGLIRDVEAGKTDLGWAGSRAFDAVGITSFDALHAPFVIDSYALEQATLEGSLPARMLPDLRSLDLVGLGLLPGPLRYLLSAPRPIQRPADLAGLRVGYNGATLPAASLRALGATPVPLPAGAPWHGVDAAEQQIASIDGNGYDRFAKYLTANAPLWPRPLVVFANKHAFSKLSPSQRAALKGAAHAAIASTLDTVRAQERSALTALCRRGIDLVNSSTADLAALRAAVDPVLTRLQRDPRTRATIASIDALRAQAVGTQEPPPDCPRQEPPSASGLPEGSYTTRITRDDLRRSHVTHPDELPPDVLNSRFMLVLKDGSATGYQIRDHEQPEAQLEGTYSLFRDHITINLSGGDVLRARWSFDGSQLRFSDFEPAGAPETLIFTSEPWVRAR